MTGANVPRVSLQRTFTILLLLYWSVHTIKLSNYHTTNFSIIIHSVIITTTNSIITVIPIFNIICLKLILTFPSVALVAALLAGGALLAHVDPYGEVCQLREAIP